jgi:hypothetical protein
MSLASLISHGVKVIATATVATAATLELDVLPSVANVAGVAVADTPDRDNYASSQGTGVAAVADTPESNPSTRNLSDPIRWPRFVALCTAHQVTESEVRAMFTERDIADLCEEPDGQLHKHTATIVAAIKRTRRYSGAVPTASIKTVKQAVKVSCGRCKHFECNTEHPDTGLGSCRVRNDVKMGIPARQLECSMYRERRRTSSPTTTT